jgi:cell division protease FtsH
MSDMHQLTDRIISRAKAIAIQTEGDSVEELTVEHFLLAFKSLEHEEAILHILQGFFDKAPQISWPNNLGEFTQEEIANIEELEKASDSKRINLSKELGASFKTTRDADRHIPLNLWLKELFKSPEHPVLLEFSEINGGVILSQESLFEQWNEIQQRVEKLKTKLQSSLTGQSTAIAMLERAYRLKCQFPPSHGPRGVLTVLGPRSTSKLNLAKAFTDALSAAEGEKYQFFTSLEELEGTDEPSVFFLDNIEEKEFSKALAEDLEAGKISDVDASNMWVVIGTGLGSEFFGSENRSGILRSALTLREEIFDVLENEVVRGGLGPRSDRQAIELELVDVLREGSLVALNSLSASDYFEVAGKFLEQISKSEFPLIPKIDMDTEAKLLFLLSLTPSLSEQQVTSSLKHFVGNQVANVWGESKNKGDTMPDGVKITLDKPTKVFLKGRKGQNALRIFIFDDDERMEQFVSQDFKGWELNIHRGVNIDDVSSFTPDIVLLDLDIRDDQKNLFGLELHGRIRESNPDLPVFLFSEKEEGAYNVGEIAKNGGARGYFHFDAQDGKSLSVATEEKQNFEKLLEDFQHNRLLEKQIAQRRQVQFAVELDFGDNPSTMTLVLKDPIEQTVKGTMFQGGGFGLVEQPSNTFKDVFGLERAKERLKHVVSLLKNPIAIEKMELRPPSGFLFTGPPGTGKTLLARAFAGEAGIPFFQLSAGELQSKFFGESEERIRELFCNARKFAPSVIFIDEIDSIASARSGMGGDTSEHHANVQNQLLTSMDGFEKDDKYVFVMAATNRVDSLDPAILRPGRFDEKIPFDLPNADTLGKMFLHFLPSLFPDNNCTELARIKARTRGFSPAQIDLVIREAKYEALKRAPESGEITFNDLDQACYQVKYGAKKRGLAEKWNESDARKRTAWHEAGHALLCQLLTPEQEIDLVTIIPHESGALGFMASTPDEESFGRSKKDLKNELVVLLAGREAERMTPNLNDFEEGINTGAGSDLERATRITFAAISQYGMDEKFGDVCLAGLPEGMRDSLNSEIHQQVRIWLNEAKEETRTKLEENSKALNALAEELVKNDSLNGERVREIVGQYSATTPGNKSANGQAQAPQIDLPVTVGQSSTLAAK